MTWGILVETAIIPKINERLNVGVRKTINQPQPNAVRGKGAVQRGSDRVRVRSEGLIKENVSQY